MKHTLKLLIPTLLFISGTVYADTIKEIAFETIDKGVYSHYKKNNRQHIIEIYDKKEWQNFWEEHTSGNFPVPELPVVKFRKYFIVIAIDEIRGSGGYMIEINKITIDTAVENRPFTIILQLNQPGSAACTTAALTRPYHIIKIKK